MELGLEDNVTVGAVADTVIVAIAVALPPDPVAVAVYVVVPVGLTTCVPPEPERVYLLPSLPVMTTDVAFVAVAVKVEVAPEAIALGLAMRVTVGADEAEDETVTVATAVAGLVPFVPVAVAVYVVVALGFTGCVPPVADSENLLPSLPVIATEVALLAVTVSVAALPGEMVSGFAVRLTVGEASTPVVVVPAPQPARARARHRKKLARNTRSGRTSRTRSNTSFLQPKSESSCTAHTRGVA